MKKAKNDLDDSFSFDTGGMDEFFPLEDPGKGSSAPKGAKGYLKNVAKSVLNLGVKVNKQLYPAVFDLGEQLFDNSDSGSRVSIKQTMSMVKQKAMEARNIGKDTLKEISNDAKQAIRTGYFVKTEEEDNDMGDAFGDMFGDDSGFSFEGGGVSFDTSSFGNDDFSSEFGDNEGSVSSHINTSETIVRAQAASTKANLKANTKLRSTIVGAVQSQIKNQSVMFAQNIELETERHRQKMIVLKNIATNIGKQIDQSNISLRAQMEYSAKSLAFSQDIAAMIKEIREATWKVSKPKEVDNKLSKSEYEKIYGDGTRFNKKAFLANFKANTMANSAGGMFDGIKMMIDSMEPLKSMGMSTPQIIKMMGGSLLREGIVDSMTSYGTKDKMRQFNDLVRGLPSALNRKMIQWSNDDTVDKAINKLAGMLPKKLGDKLKSSNIAMTLKDQIGYATVKDSVHSTTNRYDLGNPNDVHPFDNKAHVFLTQVIPQYLSSIDAGVNHKEPTTFDWQSKRFLTDREIAKVVDTEQREVIRSNSGYMEAEQEFSSTMEANSNTTVVKEPDKMRTYDKVFIDKNGKPKTREFVKEYDRMLANFQRYNYGYGDLANENNLEDMVYHIVSGTRLAKCSEEIQMFGMKMFRRGIRNMMGEWKINADGSETLVNENKEGKIALTQLATEEGSYIGRMNAVNRELEDRFAGGGSSITYSRINSARTLNEDKVNLDHKIAMAERALNNAKTKLDEAKRAGKSGKQLIALKMQYTTALSNYNKARNAAHEYSKEHRLADKTDYFNDEVKESDFMFSEGSSAAQSPEEAAESSFDKYRLSALEDESTNGLVKNIYNLLLSGIDVYTHNPSNKKNDLRTNYINTAKGSFTKREIDRRESADSLVTDAEYTELSSYEIEDFVKYDYPIYVIDDDGKYKKIKATDAVEGGQYFAKQSDVFAVNKKRKINTENSDLFELNNKINKVPLFGTIAKFFNKYNLGASSLGADFLGKHFYDIENASKASGNTEFDKEVEKAQEELKAKFGSVKNKAKEAGENIKTTASKVSAKAKDYAKDTKDFYKGEGKYSETEYGGKGSVIDSAIHLAHNIGGDIKKTKLAQLPGKIKKIYEDCRKSDEKSYKVLAKMFAGTETGKKIKEIWDAETKVWNELKDDVTKCEEFTKCVEAKNELISTIKSSEVYAKLTEKQKELFDKLEIEEKKTNVLKKLDEAKSALTTKFNELKNNENVVAAKDKVSTIAGDLKDRASSFTKSVKDSAFGEAVGKYKNAIKDEVVENTIKKDVKQYETKLMQSRIIPRVKEELGQELMRLKNKHNIPLHNAINRVSNPVFHSELGGKNDPIEKAQYLLDKASTIPELESFKEPLAKFIEKRSTMMKDIGIVSGTSYIMSKITSKLMDKVDNKAKGILNKVLDKKLLQIKVGDKTLGDVLNEICKTDPSVKDMLERAKTPVDKANVILRIQNPEIAPFKAQVRQFAEDYDKSTAGGVATAMAWNKLKSIGSKALDWLKSFGEKDKTVEELTKRLGPNLTKILGGPENVEDTLLSARLTSEDIINLKTTDPIKIAQFLISEGKFKRNIKKQLIVFMSLTLEKRDVRKSGKLSDANEYERSVAKAHIKDIDESMDQNAEGVDKKSYKKAKHDSAVKALLHKPKRSQDGDGIANTAKEMSEDKEKKKQTEQLALIAKNMEAMGEFARKANKDGLDLSKGTLKNIDESNKEAAEMTSEGTGGLLEQALDAVGLDGAADVVRKGKGLLSGLSGLANKGGFLGKIGTIATSITGAGSKLLGGIKGKLFGKAAATAATAATSTATSAAASAAASTAAGAAAKAGSKGLLNGAKNGISKMCSGLLSKIGGKAGVSTMLNKIKSKIISMLPKFAVKLGGKIASMGALAATGVGILIAAAAGFAKGMTKAKDYFKVGKGMNITTGMRLSAGLADALDSCLLGIPGLIASLCGFANPALWFYDIAGGEAEKEALERYKKYNARRAQIFGVDDPDALVAYENRSQGEGFGGTIKTGVNRGLRAVGSFLTFGLVKNNDEKDAEILGFKHVKIFQKWKSDKYEPLNELRKTIAESYGGLKIVEDMYAENLDDDEDGELDEEDKETYDRIQLQADYRVKYLEAARKYVIDNHLAYLTTHCSPEEFEKYSGTDAGKETATGFGARVKQAVSTAWKSSVIYKAGKFIGDAAKNGLKKTITASVDKIKNSFKSIGEKARKLMEKLGFNSKQKDMMEQATAAIVQTENDVDPTYHNDKVDDIKPQDNSNVGTEEGSVVNVGSNGGPESTGDGYFVQTVKEKVSPSKQQTTTKRSSGAVEKPETKLPGLSDSYDISGKVPKSTIMNSIVNDFAKNFGNDLIKRLNILDEMHKEQVRHNEVSENFFASAIGFLSTIAKNTGNIQVSSKLDDMIRQVTAL